MCYSSIEKMFNDRYSQQVYDRSPFIAAQNGDIGTIESYVKERGFWIDTPSDQGLTMMDLARKAKRIDVMSKLEELGASNLSNKRDLIKHVKLKAFNQELKEENVPRAIEFILKLPQSQVTEAAMGQTFNYAAVQNPDLIPPYFNETFPNYVCISASDSLFNIGQLDKIQSMLSLNYCSDVVKKQIVIYNKLIAKCDEKFKKEDKSGIFVDPEKLSGQSLDEQLKKILEPCKTLQEVFDCAKSISDPKLLRDYRTFIISLGLPLATNKAFEESVMEVQKIVESFETIAEEADEDGQFEKLINFVKEIDAEWFKKVSTILLADGLCRHQQYETAYQLLCDEFKEQPVINNDGCFDDLLESLPEGEWKNKFEQLKTREVRP